MKIVITIGALNIGGTERQVIQLAGSLKARGHQVVVITHGGAGVLDGALTATGVELVILGDRRWPPAIIDYVRCVRRRKPDVVYAFLPASCVRATLVAPLAGFVPVVWGVRATSAPLGDYGLKAKVVARVSQALIRFAAAVICNSEQARRELLETGQDPERVYVVPNGIDTERFRPDREMGQRFRRELGLSDGLVVGMLARFDPMKGHDDLLAAAAVLARQGIEFDLLVVGKHSEEERARFIELAATLGIRDRLVLVQAVDASEAALNAMDVLVAPSRFGEGFSNSVAEAMSCGVPVVATDVGDAAIICGQVCRVVPIDDLDALVSAISAEVAAADSGTRGSELRAAIEDRFSISAMTQSTEDVLSAVIRSGGRGRRNSSRQ